jgi:3-phosphoshikimate 1-carboxyvinyltransferase
MKVLVDVSSIQGELKAPTSKSYTHRAIAIGALSSECIIRKALFSADTLATVDACEKLGAIIEKKKWRSSYYWDEWKTKST